MSFVERFVILCPCLGEFTIGGSTVRSMVRPTMFTSCIHVLTPMYVHPGTSRQTWHQE